MQRLLHEVDVNSDPGALPGSFERYLRGVVPCEVPASWQGPAYLAPAQSPCPDDWPTAVVEGGESLTVQPPDCGCNCGSPQVSCTGNVGLHLYSGANCQTPSWMGAVPLGCSADPSGQTVSVSAANGLALSGTCPNAQGTVSNMPPVGFDGPVAACGEAAVGTGCGAGVCAPPAGAALCVYAEGDLSCPDGFSNGTLVYTGWQDTRDCDCSCSPEGSCDATVTLYGQGNGCTGQSVSFPADGNCFTFSNVTFTEWSNVTATPSNPTCGQPQTSPTGEVVPIDPVTICCQ